MGIDFRDRKKEIIERKSNKNNVKKAMTVTGNGQSIWGRSGRGGL